MNRISISTGTIVRFFAVGLSVVAAYYLFDIVLSILAAIVVASAIEPVIRRCARIGLNRIASVVVMYVSIILLLLGAMIFLVPRVIRELLEFLNNLPATISLGEVWGPLGDGSLFGLKTIAISDFIALAQSYFVSDGNTLQTVSAVSGGVISFVLIFALSFYLSAKGEGVDDFLRIITPLHHHEYIIGLWKRSRRKIGLWLQGQVVLGFIVGVLVYIMLSIVGIKHALLLALFAGLLEIIPVFGPFVAAIPAVMVAFGSYGIGVGLLVAVLYVLIQQLENHVFYPLVVRKVVGVSPIIVILSFVIGVKLAGVLGALIAVPLAAAGMEYVNDVEKGKMPKV
ncbi:MAG: AI-2E family transporter [Patescibacteria group bacterium]